MEPRDLDIHTARVLRALETSQHVVVFGPGSDLIGWRAGRRLASSIRPSRATAWEIGVARHVATMPQTRDTPIRCPHHTVSMAGLVGTADRIGEATLAHGGVLVLDTLPEFMRIAVREVADAMTHGTVIAAGRPGEPRRAWPAAFRLIATMAGCPCGMAGSRDRVCQCMPHTARRYRDRAQPILTRSDVAIVDVSAGADAGGV